MTEALSFLSIKVTFSGKGPIVSFFEENNKIPIENSFDNSEIVSRSTEPNTITDLAPSKTDSESQSSTIEGLIKGKAKILRIAEIH